MKKYLSIVLNSFVIIFALIGILGTFGMYGGFAEAGYLISYYSIITGIFMIAVSALAIVFELRKLRGGRIPKKVAVIRYLAILAFIVMMFMFLFFVVPSLYGTPDESYIYSPFNLSLHVIAPIFAVFDLFVFIDLRSLMRLETLYSLIFPYAYVVFVYVGVAMGTDFDPYSDSMYPYVFMDPEKMGIFEIGGGKFGIVWFALICAVLFVLLAYVIYLLNRYLNDRRDKRRESQAANVGS